MLARDKLYKNKGEISELKSLISIWIVNVMLYCAGINHNTHDAYTHLKI